jgi:Ca2+:H+ antiporter
MLSLLAMPMCKEDIAMRPLADHKTPSRGPGLRAFLLSNRLNLLLAFVPVAVILEILGVPRIAVFVTSALAIVPLAGIMAEATEELAHRVGPGLGGLLNATFGNAAELIIGLFALAAGLQELVKASISGSIMGNVLLVLGLSMFAGGWGRDKQTFNRTRIGASAAMLFLAVVALVMPAVFDLAVFGTLDRVEPEVETLSVLVSLVLIVTYLASLVFSLKTHRDVMTSLAASPPKARLQVREAVLVLLAATALVAVESELLVGSMADAQAAFHMTEFFMGVIVVAVVGNAAEHSSAVLMAVKDKMELSVTIAIGSSTQVALFVAPVLVFASLLMGQPMSFVFNIFEVVGIALSVLALVIVSADGESNWFEGLQLLAVYLVLAIVFYFVPGTR